MVAVGYGAAVLRNTRSLLHVSRSSAFILRSISQVAARLATGSIPFSAIYSSDLRRAADTAQAIAESCGVAEVGIGIALAI